MAIKDELLDQLMKGLDKPEDLLGDKGLLQELKKALIEKVLGAELTHHLGYERGDPAGRGTGNSRNGKSKKMVRDKDGQVEISVPRDRQGTFEPQLIKKGQTRIKGFDQKVISMYARGMTVREIQGHLKDVYAVDVSPDLISKVTSAVMEEVREWQTRPLDPVYPVVLFDALRIKIRDEGMVKNKAVYVALGINVEGIKEVLGLWVEQTEGAKFWMRVMTELKNRGVADILIAVVDGLKGFPEAITSIYPEAQIQTCIVHMVRHSLKFVPWKERKEVADDLKAIYRAETVEAAQDRLADFKDKWGDKYPTIGQSWRRNWEKVIPFLAYPPELRKLIYTTNAIESLHRSLRKNVRNRGHFPNDDAAIKLLYLVIRNISAKWRMPQRGWKTVLNQFAILFEDRLQRAIWT
jgi:putative transposase